MSKTVVIHPGRTPKDPPRIDTVVRGDGHHTVEYTIATDQSMEEYIESGHPDPRKRTISGLDARIAELESGIARLEKKLEERIDLKKEDKS